MTRGTVVTDTVQALLVSARGLQTEAQVHGDDAVQLAELVRLLEAESAGRARPALPSDGRSAG
jgi:hypothetical protein